MARLSVVDTEKFLNKWMNDECGPSLRTVLEALARVCLSIASNRREHVLTRAEAEHVWTPTAREIIRVKRFVEKRTNQYVPDRTIRDSKGSEHDQP